MAGAMAGVAMSAAAERAALAREGASAEESADHRVSDGRSKRYEAEFGMTDGDAEALMAQIDAFFGSDADASNEAFVRMVRLLDASAMTPPSVFGLIASEAKTQMKPGSEVQVGGRFRLVHAADGRISVFDAENREIILVMGSEGVGGGVKKEEAQTKVAPESKSAKLSDDLSAYALRDPWLVDSAEGGRGSEHTVTYEMIMNARGDKEAMTSVLLDMRDDFGGSDAAFNIELRNALERMDDYWHVGTLDCKFGSYRLDDYGNLWVDAPGTKPVRVVATKGS